MPRLSGVRLRVADPAASAEFYTTYLGMKAHQTGAGIRVGYAGEDAEIVLLPGGGNYQHDCVDRYWKVGLTLPNLDIAHAQISAAKIPVSQPRQFLDIGYMCHLSDPNGFQIELLQHWFDGNRPPNAGDPGRPLGGGARIGQITLRTADIIPAQATFEGLGMRQLSIQPVTTHGFDLHFWAFTDDTLPVADLTAVANREWLWQRPYTALELQHYPGAQIVRNLGYGGLELAGACGVLTDDFGDPLHCIDS